jgi:hypothetical protein
VWYSILAKRKEPKATGTHPSKGKDDLSTCRIRKIRPDSSGKEESPMDHVLYAVGDDNASVKTEYDREKR